MNHEWPWFIWTTYAAIAGCIVYLLLSRPRSYRATRLGLAGLAFLLAYYTTLVVFGPTTSPGVLLERTGFPASSLVVDRWLHTLMHTACYVILIVAVVADRGRRVSAS